MKTKMKALVFKQIPRSYRELVEMHPPRQLHDSVDHDNALEIVMAMAGHKLTRDQEDYLDLMSELIEKYEKKHDAKPRRSSPLERLRFLVEEAGMSASDLGRMLGNRGLGSVLLTGTRELSKSHIRILADHFKINPGYFF
jgi:HTH-type transcriptional regulator/antitoxin HigA